MTKQKVHSLTRRITPKLMLDAFKAVKRNRGAAGIDKVSIQMFEANLEDNLQALMRDLKQGSFEPKPLRRVFIPKNVGNQPHRDNGDGLASGLPLTRLDPIADTIVSGVCTPGSYIRPFQDRMLDR